MFKIISALCLSASLVLSGCATAPMAPADLDQKAKSFVPPKDKASLYIYRNENFGAAISMNVSVNGRMVGQTAARTYFQFDLAPGKYSIDSHTENVSNVTLTLDSGKNYFVWQEVKMGVWTARSLLQQVDEAKGKQAVMESKLIASPLSGSDIPPLDIVTPPQIQSNTSDEAGKKLRELQKLKDDGLITNQEYENKKKQILDKL